MKGFLDRSIFRLFEGRCGNQQILFSEQKGWDKASTVALFVVWGACAVIFIYGTVRAFSR